MIYKKKNFKMSWFKKQTFRRFKELNLGVAGLIICGITDFPMDV